MTTAVQHRRGTTAEHATFTGLEGEVTIDTTKDTAVIHDGVLAGGVPLARENLANVTPSGLATITGASTASDDKFFIYDQSATTLKSITRAELNNAMEIDALANVTITGGTINGTTIGNTTAAAGTFTQANFADNAKAIFGAGSDLQIYHDGTNSYISDSGQGRLIILSDGTSTRINTSTGEIMAEFVKDAEVSLRYNNALKLATTSTGIDVTGNATFADNGKAIFGAGSDLEVWHNGTDSLIKETGAGDLKIQANKTVIQSASGLDSFLVVDPANGVQLSHNVSGTVGVKLATTATGIDVTGTVVADGLTVGNTSAAASQITITSSATGVSSIYFADADPDVGRINYDHSTNALSFVTANTTKVTIDSTGSVGIGTSSPANMLHLSNTSEGTHDLAFNRNTTYGASTGLGGVSWYNQAGDTKLTRIESQTDGAATNTRLIFSTASSGTLAEKMRITSGGDLLVGTTDSDIPGDSTGSGVVLKASGRVDVTRNGILAYFNRTTSDGDLVEFRKNGATVGSIGVNGANSYIGTGDTGLHFAADLDVLNPWNPSTNGVRDNAINLGWSAGRFKDLYLSGGVYVGGTVAANKLDDYEEGTFTPKFRDGESGNIATCDTEEGHYTKIGQTVHISLTLGNIDITGLTASNALKITGLPFVCNSKGANGTVWADSVAFTDTMVANRVNGAASIQMYSVRNATTDVLLLVSAIQNATADIGITLVYFTNS